MSQDFPAGGAAGVFPATGFQADDACRWNEFNCRRASDHRKHGDPFPMPRVGKPMLATPLSRRLDAALGSLNRLSTAVFEKTDNPGLPLTHVQLWMMNDLERRVAAYGEKPSDLDEEACLRELNANLYTQEANHVMQLDADEIKILGRHLQPLSAMDLAPQHARCVLEDFASSVERPTFELEALRSDGKLVEPHWDPALKHDRAARFKLYHRLHSCGLMTGRLRQKARMGFFAVKKKGDRPGNTQRLIVDCRQANTLQQRPPATHLATPAGLAALDWTEETLQANGFDYVDPLLEAGIETGDVGDCFYNFAIPQACSWFSTGDHATREEMRSFGFDIDEIYNDETGRLEALAEDTAVYLCFAGVPMGWSWALWVAQEIVCHQCLLAVGGSPAELVQDRKPAPTIRPGQAPLGVYVDNVHTFGGHRKDAVVRMQLISEHFKQLNIPFEVDEVANEPQLDTLGMTFSFDNGVRVRGKRARVWRLWGATRALLRRRRVSGETLRIWLGHVNFHFLLARPLLSTLSATYKFAITHLGHRFPLWPSVRREIKTVLGLLLTVEKNLSAPLNSEVYIGDSSDRGFGMLSRQARHEHIQKELTWLERWRFLESDDVTSSCHPNNGGPEIGEPDEKDFTFVGSRPKAGVGCDTAFGRQLARNMQTMDKKRAPRKSLFGEGAKERTLIQVPGIPSVADHWSDPTTWDLIVSGAWRRPQEHINIKEARVALMSLRRACRTVRNLGTTSLTLSDNLVTVLSFERGRSASGPLNSLCRRAAAYAIGCNINWRLRYISTDKNVADAPSRRFGEDLPKILRRQSAELSLDAHFSIDSLEQGRAAAVSSGRRKISFDPGKKAVLELFSGSGNLTASFKQLGWRVFPDFEISKDDIYDLLNPYVQQFVINLIVGGLVWYVHLGTPCTVWSRARHNIRDIAKARKKERQSVALALFTCRVIRECIKRGVIFSLENPFSSRLWQFGPVLQLLQNKKCKLITWDMCQYGQPYRKSTTLLTNETSLCGLGRRCQGGHKHEHLQGSVRFKLDGRFVRCNRTSLAGAYPSSLCSEWARIMTEIGPVQGLGVVRWRARDGFIGALQEAANSYERSTSKSTAVTTSKPRKTTDTHVFPTEREAGEYISQHPVIFGNYTKADIQRESEKTN